MRYGRFEARVQFAPGDGIISSMFLWKPNSEQAGVFWNEIDIEKVGTQCMGYASNALYGLPESNHTLDIRSDADGCASYHTHAFEWTPDALIWLLDGTEVRRLTDTELQAYEANALPGMELHFNLWVGNADFGGNFSAASLPVHQYINWVSYSAYTPGAGDGGSDFTEQWREDFDAPLDNSWLLGTWASPLNLSVHSANNVTIVDGKAVLSLTDDAATGFSGTPPVDPTDLGVPDPGVTDPEAPDPTSPQATGGMGSVDPMDPPATVPPAAVPPAAVPPATTPATVPATEGTTGALKNSPTAVDTVTVVAMNPGNVGLPAAGPSALPGIGPALVLPPRAAASSGSSGGCSLGPESRGSNLQLGWMALGIATFTAAFRSGRRRQGNPDVILMNR